MPVSGVHVSSSLRNLICILVAMVIFSPVGFAQAGRGSITGLVSDTSGAIVPEAKVLLQNRDTGGKQTTVTTSGGLYTFVSLPPGAYDVTVSQQGFDTIVQKNVRVSVDQATKVDVTLKIG